MRVSSPERQRRGALGEALAARFLELDGSVILARGVRVAEVEVDLLVRDVTDLVLVEVKLRTTPHLPALDALRPRQVRRLSRAACALLPRHRWAASVRIDVVSIDWRPRSGRLQMRRLRGVATA